VQPLGQRCRIAGRAVPVCVLVRHPTSVFRRCGRLDP
jgi:hypothetical protein